MIKSEDENHIEEQKRELEAEQMQERRAKFVDTIEEDTDDEEISLQRYIKKNRGKEEQNENGLSREGMNLQMLLNEQDEIMEKVDEEKVEVEEVKIPDIKLQGQIEEDIKVIEVKKGFKNEKETTSTIESLKQIYG